MDTKLKRKESCCMQDHDPWLNLAQEDLKVAQLLLPEELFAPIAYHCQQAAEKALKGYLVHKRQPIVKTHELGKLLEICLKFDRDFDKIYEAARFLNPFATKFRYPSEFDIPDLDEAKLALKYAKSILNFISKKVSEKSSGQKNIFEN